MIDQKKDSYGNPYATLVKRESKANFLGALSVGECIRQIHTDMLFNNWKERVASYLLRHPEKEFTVKNVKGLITVTRIK